MAYSIGENFFKDMLKNTGNGNSNDTAYQLQARLGIYFKNNGGSTLLKSQKYSGQVGLKGENEPLGGPINLRVSGSGNAPGTPFLSQEFPFWDCNKNEVKK